MGPKGDPGPAGPTGATILNGSGAPSGGAGNDGDYYLDTDNDDLYHKSGGSWAVIVNIKGSTGIDWNDAEPGSSPDASTWSSTEASAGVTANTVTALSNGRGVLYRAVNGGGSSAGAMVYNATLSAIILVRSQLFKLGAAGGYSGMGAGLRRTDGRRVIAYLRTKADDGKLYLCMDKYNDIDLSGFASLVDKPWPWALPLWIHLYDDGTNVKLDVSLDGSTVENFYSQTRATAYGSAGATTGSGLHAVLTANDTMQMIVGRYQ